MPNREEALAFRHAPVLLQKVHSRYQRADFIARVNFAHRWPDVHENWEAVWAKRGGAYAHKIAGYAYYSLVETHTHYFLLYAFYHPQDWSVFWGSPAFSRPDQLDQHLHDMEGCLATVPKRVNPEDERVEALITIGHYDFYRFADWEFDGASTKGGYTIRGWKRSLDGAIQGTHRFCGGAGEPACRFKLYAESGSHAIKGGKKDWGNENRIVKYRPSLGRAEEPRDDGFEKGGDAYFQTVRYKLVSVFAPGGLWAQRENPRVFQTNNRGQEAFVEIDERGQFVAGSANPPWGWNHDSDPFKPGDLAWDPARLVAGYFAGLREYSRQYIHNPYIGIVRK